MTNLVLIFLAAICLGYLFKKINLPPLVAYLICGLVASPSLFGFFPTQFLQETEYVRIFIFILLLLKAGFALDFHSLKANKHSILNLCLLPTLAEVLLLTLGVRYLFGLDWLMATLLGVIISDISPAVIFPLMVNFIRDKQVKNKKAPTCILAAVALNNVIILTTFAILIKVILDKGVSLWHSFLMVPLAILFGAIGGWILGRIILSIFKLLGKNKYTHFLIILFVSVFLFYFEISIQQIAPFSSLVAIVAMSVFLYYQLGSKAEPIQKFLKEIWKIAELILFVLVGGLVNVPYMFEVGLLGLLIFILGIGGRSLVVFFISKKETNRKAEQLFYVTSFLPKATVQAVIGPIPLALGLPHGELILSLSVLAIICMAPLGAILAEKTGKKALL